MGISDITRYLGQGGRADILVRNQYKNGMWSMEVMRLLKIEGKDIQTQDIQFTDMTVWNRCA